MREEEREGGNERMNEQTIEGNKSVREGGKNEGRKEEREKGGKRAAITPKTSIIPNNHSLNNMVAFCIL